MGTNTVLLCNTCKVALWSKYRIIFDYATRKKLSGKVGVRKLGRMTFLIKEVDKFQKKMEGRGIVSLYHFIDTDRLRTRFTEIKDFMVRHYGHNIAVTGDFDGVPDPTDEWYQERGWKMEGAAEIVEAEG